MAHPVPTVAQNGHTESAVHHLGADASITFSPG